MFTETQAKFELDQPTATFCDCRRRNSRFVAIFGHSPPRFSTVDSPGNRAIVKISGL